MIKNILLKTTALTLTLGFLINSSFATEINLDDKLFDSKELKTAQQLVYQAPEEIRERVFSGKPLLNISSYLGRLEVGRIQQVNKSINHSFREDNKLHLWKDYAQQLHLDVRDVTCVDTLISHIKGYYVPQVYSVAIHHQKRFKNIIFNYFDCNKSIFIGHAQDSQKGHKRTPIQLIDGEIRVRINVEDEDIKGIGLLNAVVPIITGLSTNSQNNNKFKNIDGIDDEDISGASAIDDEGLIKLGHAIDRQNDNEITIIRHTDGEIKSLDDIDNECRETIRLTRANGPIELEIKWDDKTFSIHTNISSNTQKRSFFKDFYFKEFQKPHGRLIALITNGSHFTLQFENDPLYHIIHLPNYITDLPNYNLWKMK